MPKLNIRSKLPAMPPITKVKRVKHEYIAKQRADWYDNFGKPEIIDTSIDDTDIGIPDIIEFEGEDLVLNVIKMRSGKVYKFTWNDEQWEIIRDRKGRLHVGTIRG